MNSTSLVSATNIFFKQRLTKSGFHLLFFFWPFYGQSSTPYGWLLEDETTSVDFIYNPVIHEEILLCKSKIVAVYEQGVSTLVWAMK